jgi:hypothetical protein
MADSDKNVPRCLQSKAPGRCGYRSALEDGDSKLKYDHVFGINKGFLYVRVKENSTMARRNVGVVL